MIIKTASELEAMQEIGHICAMVLRKMGEALEPGITTKELDEIGGRLLAAEGAQSAPIYCYQFPGYNCISVNEAVAHGIPDDRVIQPGDIVNIDVSAVKNGFFSDNGASFAVPPVKNKNLKLMACGKETLELAIAEAVAGAPLNHIGRMVQKNAHRNGYGTVRNLCGHGIGHTLHDDPEMVLNYYDRHDKRLMTPGLVLAIEPFVSEREEYVVEAENGWTLYTPQGSQVVQYEYTVMVQEDGGPLVLSRERS